MPVTEGPNPNSGAKNNEVPRRGRSQGGKNKKRYVNMIPPKGKAKGKK